MSHFSALSVQLARDEMINIISDVTKDIYGFRVRYDYSSMTLSELSELCDETIAAADIYFDEKDYGFDDCFEAEAADAAEWNEIKPDQWDELCEVRGW